VGRAGEAERQELGLVRQELQLEVVGLEQRRHIARRRLRW
jgi:hypothetical protein